MKYLLAFISLAMVAVSGCKKKDSAPPTVPTLTTTAVTNINGSTAQSGGTITGNGNATITVSGICWSKTNATPTITDDTTKGNTGSGSFTSMLKSLVPSAMYYVRAYATNSAGTGYGNVVTFNTGNAAPEARNITIVGTAAVTNKINASYTYYDFENDAKATASYQWYVAADTTGNATGTAISGATDSTYSIVAGDQGKYLRVAITPKASAGTTTGNATNSRWVGPVGAEPTSVTFTYNGASVTYGIIISPVTQKRWMDRNLGATRAATSSDDYQAYGDLFQWGRPADGHQLITWTNSTTGAGVNGTTTTVATSDVPGNNLFIMPPNAPYDWRSDFNTNRWNTNPQGPCPLGWHVPTKDEWNAETAGSPLGDYNPTTAYNQLKLPMAGIRYSGNGNVYMAFGTSYWSSTNTNGQVSQLNLTSGNGGVGAGNNLANGYSIRCIKD